MRKSSAVEQLLLLLTAFVLASVAVFAWFIGGGQTSTGGIDINAGAVNAVSAKVQQKIDGLWTDVDFIIRDMLPGQTNEYRIVLMYEGSDTRTLDIVFNGFYGGNEQQLGLCDRLTLSALRVEAVIDGGGNITEQLPLSGVISGLFSPGTTDLTLVENQTLYGSIAAGGGTATGENRIYFNMSLPGDETVNNYMDYFIAINKIEISAV